MNGASYPKKITNADSCRMEPLPQEFSVCKVEDYSGIDMEQPFVFTGSTDEEKSLVCPTGMVPENTTSREDGWRAFRICGELDFSLIGILAGISRVMADAGIGIFVISTFNTDYVLVKEYDFEKAKKALTAAEYKNASSSAGWRLKKEEVLP